MSIEEVFSKLATHMKEGLLFHEQVAISYNFVGLCGYSKEHWKHYIEESEQYRNLQCYYSEHYHKLIKIEDIPKPDLISNSWYKYTTMAVDMNTKKNTIKELMSKWVEWEQATKKLYQEMRREAYTIDEVAAANYIDKLIKEVTKELKGAEQELIDLESMGYDMPTIVSLQKRR